MIENVAALASELVELQMRSLQIAGMLLEYVELAKSLPGDFDVDMPLAELRRRFAQRVWQQVNDAVRRP